MVDNQHRRIKGYRDLTEDEIALMNKIKEKGAEIGELVDQLMAQPELDKRWLSIGKTHLQQGLMALVRGVARPDFF